MNPKSLPARAEDVGDERVRRQFGSRVVRSAEPVADVRYAIRKVQRTSQVSPELFPGAEVLVVRRRRIVLRATVVHLAERWARANGRLVPLPHHAPRRERLVGLAVRDPETGEWKPRVVRRAELRSKGWRAPVLGLPWTRETVRGLDHADALAWRALEERMPWMVGELPIMESLRAEARRLGALYGYPRCCVANYAARMPEVPPTVDQTRAALGGGFVPCPACARRVCAVLDRGDFVGASYVVGHLLAARLYPAPLRNAGGYLTVEPSPLAVPTRTYAPQPEAWCTLIDARSRRVEAAAIQMQLRSGGRRGKPRHPLPRAAEAQAILQHWVDRETRLIDSMRWLLTERRPPSAKKDPRPRGGKRPW
jgi:hypothetical protein